MKLKRVLSLLTLLASMAAQAASIGDPAPPILVNDTVKGTPVDLAAGKGKQIFVVEFWATWCPPCRESIPHLTQLQKKYQKKGVTIIGISDETVEAVKPFVRKMGGSMNYVVAVDTDHRTYAPYMDAYGREMIPTAFVVDTQGRVAWVGYPEEGLEEVLEKMVAGTFDIEAVKKEFADAEARAKKLLELNMVFGKYLQLSDAGEKTQASAEFSKLLEIAGSDARFLGNIAWTLLTNDSIKNRDLPLALRVAKQGVDASAGKEPSVLDIYARALFDNGKVAEAIEQQKLAIALTSDKKLKAELEKTLKDYKRKRS